MARSGKKVMHFLSGGRYVANFVDGEVTLYSNGLRAARFEKWLECLAQHVPIFPPVVTVPSFPL